MDLGSERNRKTQKEGTRGGMSQNSERIQRVAFIDNSLKKAFERLEKGKYEDKELMEFIRKAIENLKQNPLAGTPVPSKLWPKEYIQKYQINNLRKYDLSRNWRMLYTIKGNEVEIISIIIEWIAHKDYERKFGYKRS